MHLRNNDMALWQRSIDASDLTGEKIDTRERIIRYHPNETR
jgi:hypothetical protein